MPDATRAGTEWMQQAGKTAAVSASTASEIMKNTTAKSYVSRAMAAAVSLMTPLVVAEQNQARAAGACDTAAPVNNTAVDCFGGTITANDPNGWGTGTETGDTITVESDASLHGNNAGIFVKDATIQNQGSIAGASFGIFFNSTSIVSSVTNGANQISGLANAINAAGDVTVSNGSGKIFSNGAGGIGILAGGAATIDNAQGQITGDFAAIKAFTVNIKSNDGIVEAFATPGPSTPVVAVRATGDVTVHNGHGNIHAVSTGAVAIQSDTGMVTINANDGDIAGGFAAITAPNVTVNSNNNNITALDTGSAAIRGDAVTVVSNGTAHSSISGGEFGINANTVTVQGNNGTIEARDANGIGIFAVGKATVSNGDDKGVNATISGGAFGIRAATLDITNFFGATISSANGVGIQGSGSIVNAGTISGALQSVNFTGGAGATNTLTLQGRAVLIGDAVGSAGANNKLVLEGRGIANNNFLNFNSLTVKQGSFWDLNGDAVVGTTTLEFNTSLVVGDNGHGAALLTGNVTVGNGSTLSGLGTVGGDVNVTSGGVLSPGSANGTLKVTGNVSFSAGSKFFINAAPTDASQLAVGGTATLGGGAVLAVTSGTAYAPSTKFTILTAANGVSGTFDSNNVTATSAFLKPSLSYDANDVFLTLDLINGGGGGGGGTGFGFASVAQTRNQGAVAGALDAGAAGAIPVTNPLLLAVLAQSADGARQAFDALSGEVFGSVQNTQLGQMHFTREAMLGRMRQAAYSYDAPYGLGALGFGGPELAYASGDSNANPMAAIPGKAPERPQGPSRDLTFWAQGLGGWGHADSDGNAASLKSRFGGFLSGADARLGETWRAGLVAGYMRTDLNVDDRASSAGIDSVQFGGYAGGKLGAFNVRGGASYSYDRIDTSRGIVFSGFTDQTHAHFHGNVGQVFGEVGYGVMLGQVALEPLAGLAYVNVRDDSFAESGGLAALSASGTSQSTGYSTLGLRAATAMPLANGTVLIPRGSVQWQYAFGDVTPVTAMAFQSLGTSFTVAGIPIARNTALFEGGFDWRFSAQAKLGAYYQGELAAHAESHAFKGAFTWDF